MSEDRGWEVRVIETSTGNLVHRIPCRSESQAEKVERGVLINMDRDRFCTLIANKDTDQ